MQQRLLFIYSDHYVSLLLYSRPTGSGSILLEKKAYLSQYSINNIFYLLIKINLKNLERLTTLILTLPDLCVAD